MPPSSFIIDQFGNKVSNSNPFPVLIYYSDESMRILNSDDAVTTINYVDSNKDEVVR